MRSLGSVAASLGGDRSGTAAPVHGSRLTPGAGLAAWSCWAATPQLRVTGSARSAAGWSFVEEVGLGYLTLDRAAPTRQRGTGGGVRSSRGRRLSSSQPVYPRGGPPRFDCVFELLGPCQHLVKPHCPVRQQSRIETGFLSASGAGFGHKQIHRIKATGDTPVGRGRLQPNQAVFPALRQVRRFGPHALRVVAEVVVEERQLSKKTKGRSRVFFPPPGADDARPRPWGYSPMLPSIRSASSGARSG